MKNLWRVHLRPDPSQRSADPVALCLEQGVVGIGWHVSSSPANRDDYWALGKKEYGTNGWSAAANAIGWRMADGDLVWMRNWLGVYHLGMIEGAWEYRDSEEYRQADIVNVRRCQWHEVGTCIAGKIVSSFIPSRTIQAIHDHTASLYSQLTYTQLTGYKFPDADPPSSLDILSLLSSEDLEDLVGLYLQTEKGMLIVPSTRCKRDSTIAYEYEMVDRKTGEQAYVQVKSGKTTLDPTEYYQSKGKFFLFASGNYDCESSKPHVTCIDTEEMREYIASHRNLLPRSICTWVDYVDKHMQDTKH